MTPTPILPVPLPANTGGLKPSVLLKRINPATGVPFRQGDVRAGGHKFYGYKSIVVKRTGLLGEDWRSPESFEKVAAYRAKHYSANVETIATQRALYRAANVEKVAAQRAEYYKSNAEKIAAHQAKYYKSNVEKIAAQRASYRAVNVEKIAARNAKYAKNNPGKINAHAARRRAAKLLRTPPWLTAQDLADIAEIYVLCAERTKITGVPHAVDHVIPLMGRTVSGLHIAANLQIITASENSSKHNKYVQE